MSSLNNLNLNKEDETKPIQDTLSDNIPLQIEWVSSWIYFCPVTYDYLYWRRSTEQCYVPNISEKNDMNSVAPMEEQ